MRVLTYLSILIHQNQKSLFWGKDEQINIPGVTTVHVIKVGIKIALFIQQF
jgi:hypothetical protein